MAELLEGETPRRRDGGFGGHGGPTSCGGLSSGEGLPHTLLVLADLRRVVREEERAVAAHRPGAEPRDQHLARADPEHRRQPAGGARPGRPLGVGGGRALRVDGRPAGEALSRFLAAYARLAKLPPPTLAPGQRAGAGAAGDGADWTQGVRVVPGPPAWVRGDADQWSSS